MLRAHLCFSAAALMTALAGCNQGGSGATTSTTESTPNAAASGAESIDTEAKAREFAAARVTEYVASQSFTDDAGNPISPPKIDVDTWRQAEQEGDRWKLKRGPPGNWYFRASFNADGSNPEYEVVYFSE